MFQCSIDLEPSEFGESNSGERGERPEVDPPEREPILCFPEATDSVELVDGRSDTREALMVRH